MGSRFNVASSHTTVATFLGPQCGWRARPLALRLYRQLTFIAQERSDKSGWVAHMYKEKFGVWPVSRTVAPEPPKPEVRS
jgi:hypothetical protein